MEDDVSNLLTIKIEAFGAIERQLPEHLQLQYPNETAVIEVLAGLVVQFPHAAQMLERCACAIGEDIIGRQQILMHDTTLVLLSPVAGG